MLMMMMTGDDGGGGGGGGDEVIQSYIRWKCRSPSNLMGSW